jgi:hypothetical protein
LKKEEPNYSSGARSRRVWRVVRHWKHRTCLWINKAPSDSVGMYHIQTPVTSDYFKATVSSFGPALSQIFVGIITHPSHCATLPLLDQQRPDYLRLWRIDAVSVPMFQQEKFHPMRPNRLRLLCIEIAGKIGILFLFVTNQDG